MVICESNGFIFLRIPKNASTSLATYLIKEYCNKTDTYTGVGDSGITKQNVPDGIISKYRIGYRFIHLTLNELVQNKLITEEKIRNMKVYGVIREPLDRQLSLYFFKKRSRANYNPDDFRMLFQNGYCESDQNNRILQSEYCKLGTEDVGHYWLYDKLNEALNQFKQIFPPQNDIGVPTYKSSLRQSYNKQDLIDEYYDQKTKDAVLKYYEKDFELYERLRNEN